MPYILNGWVSIEQALKIIDDDDDAIQFCFGSLLKLIKLPWLVYWFL